MTEHDPSARRAPRGFSFPTYLLDNNRRAIGFAREEVPQPETDRAHEEQECGKCGLTAMCFQPFHTVILLPLGAVLQALVP